MAFIKSLAEQIYNNYLENDSLPKIIVFPNKSAAHNLRQKLAHLIPNNNIDICSIQEAVEKWSNIKLAKLPDLILSLLQVNANLKGDVHIENNLFSLSSQIIKDFDEIDQYLVEPDSIFQNLYELKQIENWLPNEIYSAEEKEEISHHIWFFSRLQPLYESFRQSLINSKKGYYGLIIRELCTNFKDNINKLDKVVFAGFNALTKGEIDIITHLINEGKAEIIWNLDHYYFDDERQEAGLSARKFFKKYPLSNRNRIIFSDNLCQQKKKIKVIHSSGNIIQTFALKKELETQKQKTSNREVVVLTDENLLIPVRDILPENIHAEITMDYPYKKTEIYRFFRQKFSKNKTLSHKDGTTYIWSFAKILEGDFFQVFFGKNQTEIIKNWLRAQKKKANFNISDDDITNSLFPKLRENVNVNSELLCSLIAEVRKPLTNIDDTIKFISNIVDIITQLNVDNTFVKAQITTTSLISQNLIKLFNFYNKTNLNIDDFFILFDQIATESRLELESDDNSDELQIMGLLETRNNDFDTVHILSVNEDILPKSKTSSSLIPYDIRRNFGLPVYSDSENIFSYHFFSLLQDAKEIYLYYNSLHEGVGSGEKSRYIRQIYEELAPKNLSLHDLTEENEEIFSSSFYDTPIINNEVKKDADILAKIKEFLYKKDDKNNKIKGLSATSLSCYKNCQFSFYLKYILGLQEEEVKETAQLNVLGSVVHGTLENLYKIFNSKPVDIKLFDETVAQYREQCYEEACKANNFTGSITETGFNIISQKVIKKMLDDIIDYDRETIRKNGNITFLSLEEQLYFEENCGDFTFIIHGNADRIDKIGDIVRIIDYKTGKVSKTDVTVSAKKDAEFTDKSMQLMIYKYLYARRENINIDNIRPTIFATQNLNQDLSLVIEEPNLTNDFLNTFQSIIHEIVAEMLDPEVPFTQAEESKCSFCLYKAICGR